ncbi:MAG: methionine aminotransferase [Myxococcota bacterium]|nr:methionine aminotransferase [Myxococcota bacterium]
MAVRSKLPQVGTTIFTVMSGLAEKTGSVNLGQGFPDFDPPERLLAALDRHARGGKNQYAPMAGLLRLRQAIAHKFGRDYGAEPDPEHEITITSGATEAIFDVIAALIGPGDEAVLLDPCFDSYEPAVLLQGGRPVHVPLAADFTPDFERLAAALTERTRLVIVNYPHNPSGAVLAPEHLQTLARVLRGRDDVYLISDEVYEHIVFDEKPFQSVLRSPELRARSFVIGSFGKAFHATGWKVGWVVAPPELSAELRKVHQFVTFATSTPTQHALADVLEQEPEHLQSLSRFYQDKRDEFRALLAGSRFQLLPVGGTYFQLADYSQLSSEGDLEFARRLAVEARVAVIPVSALSATPLGRRLIRFCFAKSRETLELAAGRLLELGRR